MKVSVVMPVYNAMPYLRQCVESVLSQTLQDFELLCVDDGSSDNSAEVLDEYAAQDQRLTVVRQQNGGAGAARNQGIERAKGDYLVFLDSDDFYEPDMLELQYRQITKTGADVCACGGLEYRNDTGEYLPWGCLMPRLTPRKEAFTPASLGRYLFRFTFSGPTNKMIRRDFVLAHGFRFQEIRHSNDVCFICLCLSSARRLTVCDEKPLVYYRIGLTNNLQSHNVKGPLDNIHAAMALQAGMRKEGTYPALKRGYDNLTAFELESYATKLMRDQTAFSTFFDWLRDGGREKYGISLSSLDAGTLSNELMTFEGVDAGTMDNEQVRQRILANKEKYAGMYRGRKKERFRYLYRRLRNMEGTPRATIRCLGYLLDGVRQKVWNRRAKA